MLVGKVSRRIALVSMAVGMASAAQAQVKVNPYQGIVTVEVFANSSMVIAPARSDRYKLAIYRLDAMEILRQRINQQIPRGGAEQASAWMMANAARIKREFQPVAAQTANAMNLAHYFHLDRLPAVVINRKAVVYGVTDVDAALQRFQSSRGGR
jgi:integrating conjugative element protein (TIGR03757 family)